MGTTAMDAMVFGDARRGKLMLSPLPPLLLLLMLKLTHGYYGTGYYGGLGHYGYGLGHYGYGYGLGGRYLWGRKKRSAEAGPAAEAEADPWLYYGGLGYYGRGYYGGYYGLGHRGYYWG